MATSAATTAAAGAKFRDLSDTFTRSACYCLNEHPSHPFGNLFIGDHTLQLKSDADGMFVLHSHSQSSAVPLCVCVCADAVASPSPRVAAPQSN